MKENMSINKNHFDEVIAEELEAYPAELRAIHDREHRKRVVLSLIITFLICAAIALFIHWQRGPSAASAMGYSCGETEPVRDPKNPQPKGYSCTSYGRMRLN
jgi:uncharacterized membrane protein YccC